MFKLKEEGLIYDVKIWILGSTWSQSLSSGTDRLGKNGENMMCLVEFEMTKH